MELRWMNRGFATALVVSIIHTGCGSNPLELDVIALAVTGPITVSVTSPLEFEITATNVSSERVVWGLGSSSCQFGLYVEGDEIERQNIAFRACTEDLAEQGLNPGQSRTEVIEWDGQISVSGLMSPLPAGLYQVIATAGSEYESEPLVITIVNP